MKETRTSSLESRAAGRHPLQSEIDGDFVLDEIVSSSSPAAIPGISVTQAISARLWQVCEAAPGELFELSEPGVVAEHELTVEPETLLLHRFETSGVFNPPVHTRVAAMTSEVGTAWLALAAHWIRLAQAVSDLRFLNAACKLVGAVWLRRGSAGHSWGGAGLAAQLATVGRLLDGASGVLRACLANRVLLPAATGPSVGEDLDPPSFTGAPKTRTAVLATTGSRSAGRLTAAATAAGLPIKLVCWYDVDVRDGVLSESNYSSAWYPPSSAGRSSVPPLPEGVPCAVATSWDAVAAEIRAAEVDLLLLVGMPIVPARVLSSVRLGVLNAHNGALPGYRGMDAVGWAILNNDAVVCSLHLAEPVVDAGAVLAVEPVPLAPLRSLASRVKVAQLKLLLAGAAHVAATGALPDTTSQRAVGTQFYRLHPHLKRLLDASPYATDVHLERTVTEP